MSVPASPPSAPRPVGTVRLATVGGTQILVSYTTLLFAAVFAVILAPQVEAVRPGLGPLRYLAGAVFAALLYLAVLLHEISHALVARRFGTVVPSITLHFLGGMTAVQGEARSPRQEFWVAVVGPLTSLAVGGVAWLAYQQADQGLVGLFLFGLAAGNLLIGVLNLVPGLPLDGGRVLKSAIWGATGNVHRGTIIAGWCGRVLAVLVLLWPFYVGQFTDTRQDLLDYAFAIIIALFLWSGATSAMASARMRRRLPSLVARPLVRRSITVTEDTPLAEAVRRAGEAEAASIVTVTTSGTPVGVVSETAVAATPEERRPWVPVSSVARTIDPSLMLPAAIRGEELIMAMSRRPANEYLIVEADGSLLGVLVTADVDKAFREARH